MDRSHLVSRQLLRLRRIRALRRPLLSRPSSSSSIAAWITEITQRPPTTSTDFLDPASAKHLIRTLPTRQAQRGSSQAEATTLPRGHHLIYFQPQTWFSDLGPDGSSTEYNAPHPYTRRMWAGGSIEWPSTAPPLNIGSRVTESVSVPGAEVKKDMMFIHQQRDLFASGQDVVTGHYSVREVRTHVFRPDVAVKTSSSNPRPIAALPSPDVTFTYTPTSPLLFRYSALTFNGHKIHYDLSWTRKVEGHPDLVVHGPLTATLLIEIAENAAVAKGGHIVKFEYRAVAPMYVDREVKMGAKWEDGRLKLWAEQEGRVGMTATAAVG